MLFAIMANAICGGTVAAMAGFSPVVGAVALNAVAAVSPMFGIQGLRAGLYTEIWTGETIEALRKEQPEQYKKLYQKEYGIMPEMND